MQTRAFFVFSMSVFVAKILFPVLYWIDLFYNRTKFKTSLTDVSPFLTIVAALITKC